MIEVGKQYRFDYPSVFISLPEYTARANQIVTVVRPLTEDEADGPSVGEEQMYLVRAEDGWEGHAFESELEVVP